MQYRHLRDLEVSAIGLGCMGMTGGYVNPNVTESESIAVIHRAIDLGVTLFDTAEVYGPYKNEELLGRAIKGKRDNIIIATKFGFNIEDGKNIGLNSSPANVRAAVEGSLKRLGVDVIDLLYQHRVDRSIPIEETVGAMAQLVKEGKVRYLGLSEAGATNISKAHAVHPITALQSEYSLWERGLEEKIIPLLSDLQIGLVPFSPLGRGFLSGKIQQQTDVVDGDFRNHDLRFSKENFSRNLDIVERVKKIATNHNATLAQIALAWVLTRGVNVVPIPGTTKVSRLEENLGAVDVKLTDDDLRQLNVLARLTSGPRYSPTAMAFVDKD